MSHHHVAAIGVGIFATAIHCLGYSQVVTSHSCRLYPRYCATAIGSFPGSRRVAAASHQLMKSEPPAMFVAERETKKALPLVQLINLHMFGCYLDPDFSANGDGLEGESICDGDNP